MNSKLFIVAMCLGCFGPGEIDFKQCIQNTLKQIAILAKIAKDNPEIGKKISTGAEEIITNFNTKPNSLQIEHLLNGSIKLFGGIVELYVKQKDQKYEQNIYNSMVKQLSQKAKDVPSDDAELPDNTEVFEAALTLAKQAQKELSDEESSTSSVGISDHVETYSSRSSVMPDTSETEPTTVPHSVETSETEPVEKTNVGVTKEIAAQDSECDEEETDTESKGSESERASTCSDEEYDEYTEERLVKLERRYKRTIDNILKEPYTVAKKKELINITDTYLKDTQEIFGLPNDIYQKIYDGARKTDRYKEFATELLFIPEGNMGKKA